MAPRSIEQKKRRRVAKALRRTPLPARMDLVEWLVSRGHASTRRAARELILAKQVRSESHVLGVTTATVPAKTALMDAIAGREPKFEEQDVVAPLVDARLRGSITVSA